MDPKEAVEVLRRWAEHDRGLDAMGQSRAADAIDAVLAALEQAQRERDELLHQQCAGRQVAVNGLREENAGLRAEVERLKERSKAAARADLTAEREQVRRLSGAADSVLTIVDVLLKERAIYGPLALQGACSQLRAALAETAQPTPEERGWLIESRFTPSPRWFSGIGPAPWTTDAGAAVRFCRRQDAEAARVHLPDAHMTFVSEHIWLDRAETAQEEQQPCFCARGDTEDGRREPHVHTAGGAVVGVKDSRS